MFDCTVGLNHREAASPPSGGLLVESRNVPIRRGCMSQSPIAVAVLLVMQNTTHIALAQHAAIFCVQLHSRAACVRVTRHTHESNHCICSKLQHECGVGGRPDAATTHLSTKALTISTKPTFVTIPAGLAPMQKSFKVVHGICGPAAQRVILCVALELTVGMR